jgi:DNA-binding NarL/FixJ family response regulator
MATVLICDDQRVVREGLRRSLVRVPGVDRVVTVARGEDVLDRWAAERPALVLMDVGMPGLGGVEATRRLVAEHPDANVIVLVGRDEHGSVATAVAGGARGYLLKDAEREELLATVAHALAELPPPRPQRPLPDRPPPQLTHRELQVLQGMSQGKSNAQIGRELYLSEDTIKTYARRLFRKLEVGDRAQAVALGFRWGLVR